MVRREDPVDPLASREARRAGVRGGERLTLKDVDKRRLQLWWTSLFIVVAVTVAIAVVYLGDEFLPESFRFYEDLSNWVVVVLVGGLALAFLVYVIEKELHLRKLTSMLVDERVLSAALANRLKEISALSEVGKAINTTLDLNDLLQMILSSALELLGGTEGSIMLLDESQTHLEVVSYKGPAMEVVSGRTEVGRGIAGTVAERREPMLIHDDDLAELGPGHPERGIRSSMCVPLIRRDELLGVLNLNETEGKRRFTVHDLEALGLFAEHAAIAIGNASLFERERETVARLEELDRLKSDFVATVSHELKTPLTAIIGSATTLSRRGPRMNEDQRGSFIEMIERQGQRLLRLVEDILTSAQIESGMPRLRRELVDLRGAAEVIIGDLAHSQYAEGREINLRTNPEQPHVWGDLGALQQILSNLIENSLKYSGDTGPIDVYIEENEVETRLVISDQGAGIPSDKLDSIFDRFRQADQSLTRGRGGVGLGLYIVKSLVDAHNGTIEVSSQEGEGASFAVIMPKRAEDRQRPLLEAPPAARPV